MGITTGLLEGEFEFEVFRSKEDIIEFIDDNPDLTYEEIGERMELSEYVIRRVLGLLQ